MIVLYVDDNKVNLLNAKVVGKRIHVKSVNEYPISAGGSNFSVLKKIKRRNKKEGISVVIDGAIVRRRDVIMPCVDAKALIKTVKKIKIKKDKKYKSGVDVDNIVRSPLKATSSVNLAINKKVNLSIRTEGHLDIVPKGTILAVGQMTNQAKCTVKEMNLAERAIDKFVADYGKSLYSNNSILVNINDKYITLTLYSRRKRISTDKYIYSCNDEGQMERLLEIVQCQVNAANTEHNILVDKIYLTGLLYNVSTTISSILRTVKVDAEVLPMPKKVKGITSEEFNKYLPLVAGTLFIN